MKNTVVVAFKKEYQMIDIITSESFSLINYSGDPKTLSLNDDTFFVLSKTSGFFFNSRGSECRPQISWNRSPKEIGYHSPYIIGLRSQDITVFNEFNGTLVQTIEMGGLDHIYNGFEYTFLYNSDTLYLLYPYPIFEQASILITQGHVKDGLELYTKSCRRNPKFQVFCNDFLTIEKSEIVSLDGRGSLFPRAIRI